MKTVKVKAQNSLSVSLSTKYFTVCETLYIHTHILFLHSNTDEIMQTFFIILAKARQHYPNELRDKFILNLKSNTVYHDYEPKPPLRLRYPHPLLISY